MESRRSVRDFMPTPLPEGSLERILEAGLLGPSGADTQPFTFIVVTDVDAKRRLRERAESVEAGYHGNRRDDAGIKEWMRKRGISHEKPFLTDAPVLVVVAGDKTGPYWRESTWLAIAYLILAIEAEGLASLTYTPSDTGFLNALLDLPEEFSPQVVIPVGYPSMKPPPKEARPAGKVFGETFGPRS